MHFANRKRAYESQLVKNSDRSKSVSLALNAGRESPKVPLYVLSAPRSLPKTLQTGPVGGESVSQFSTGRKDHEVLQLHSRQQPTPAPHLHARDVVSVPGRQCRTV